MTSLTRWLRHVFAPSSQRRFPSAALERITAAIAAGEARHRGEICFAVEAALPLRSVLAGLEARGRADEVFAQLRVWDTEENNGVLLYLLLADHRIELVADRGFRSRVDASQWREVCARMETGLRAGQPEQAVVDGVDALSALIAAQFPRVAGAPDTDELPNRPHLL